MSSSIMKRICDLSIIMAILVSCLLIAPATAASPKVIAIDAHDTLSLALKDDGTVMAWGDMRVILPDRRDFFKSYYPVAVNVTDVTSISSGVFGALFLKNDGTVWAWGYNEYGEIGDGTNITKLSDPVQVKGLYDIIAISSGGCHNLALKSDGTVLAWGCNDCGQIGIGETSYGVFMPVEVPGLPKIKEISAGYKGSMAIDESGKLWSWGLNEHGKLGDGTDTTRLAPVKVQINDLIQVDAGEYDHTLALKNDGTVWAWGWNQGYQLGFIPVGNNKNRYTPVQVQGLTNVRAISASGDNSLAIANNGTVWIWGENQGGKFGAGALYGYDSEKPVQVPGLADIIAIASGIDYLMALSSNGNVYAWGDNQWGEIGIGAAYSYTEAVTKPTLVLGEELVTPTQTMIKPEENSTSPNATSGQSTGSNNMTVVGLFGIAVLICSALYIFIKSRK